MNDASPIPNPEQLREMIATAKDALKKPSRREAAKVVDAFATHIRKLVEDPSKFTSTTGFSYDNPLYDGDSVYFYDCIRKMLPGYTVEKSHDGGGMFEVVCITWEETTPTVRSRARLGGFGYRDHLDGRWLTFYKINPY